MTTYAPPMSYFTVTTATTAKPTMYETFASSVTGFATATKELSARLEALYTASSALAQDTHLASCPTCQAQLAYATPTPTPTPTPTRVVPPAPALAPGLLDTYPAEIDLDVSASDILGGVRQDSQNCAVARAARRRFDGAQVQVSQSGMSIVADGHYIRYKSANGDLGRFVNNFDNGIRVRPTTIHFVRVEDGSWPL